MNEPLWEVFVTNLRQRWHEWQRDDRTLTQQMRDLWEMPTQPPGPKTTTFLSGRRKNPNKTGG